MNHHHPHLYPKENIHIHRNIYIYIYIYNTNLSLYYSCLVYNKISLSRSECYSISLREGDVRERERVYEGKRREESEEKKKEWPKQQWGWQEAAAPLTQGERVTGID